MPRPEKVEAVAEIKERIEGAQAVFLAEYAGLSVKDQQTLRRELRASGAEFKVVKMTLARRAAAELEIDTLDELLLGPTGLAIADGDPVTAAKALKNFSKDHDVFVVKGGLLGMDFLSPETVSELADVEPREVLLAKLAGAMKAPMTNLAGLIAALPRNTASALQQLLEKKEAGEFVSADEVVAEAPTEEAPAEEAPADEASADEAEASDAEDAPEAAADEATSDDSADDASEDDAAPEADAEEAPAEEASVDDAEEAEEADEADKTEDTTEASAEASEEDADDETEDQADEASDDAEEE